MRIRLPQPPKRFKKEADLEELTEYLFKLIQALERTIERLPETPFTKDRIKVTGLTPQYTLDASAGTLADVRAVLGTILTQLQESGKIS